MVSEIHCFPVGNCRLSRRLKIRRSPVQSRLCPLRKPHKTKHLWVFFFGLVSCNPAYYGLTVADLNSNVSICLPFQVNRPEHGIEFGGWFLLHLRKDVGIGVKGLNDSD